MPLYDFNQSDDSSDDEFDLPQEAAPPAAQQQQAATLAAACERKRALRPRLVVERAKKTTKQQQHVVDVVDDTLQLTDSSIDRVNGKYLRVKTLPEDARAQATRGYPIWRHESHSEVHILRTERKWWISHYQPATMDYYFSTSREFPRTWHRCTGDDDALKVTSDSPRR